MNESMFEDAKKVAEERVRGVDPASVLENERKWEMRMEALVLAHAKRNIWLFADWYLSKNPGVNTLYEGVMEFATMCIRYASTVYFKHIASAMGYKDSEIPEIESKILRSATKNFEKGKNIDYFIVEVLREASATEDEVSKYLGGEGAFQQFIKEEYKNG